MGLSSAMNTGVTGLGINAEAITVVGNNIANVNTIGFKEGRTIFSDILSANIGAGQVGRGGQIQAVQNNFTQGSFENTSSGNDLAIQGEAMFVVKDASGQQFYSRAGVFDYNQNQILSNASGLQVMGYGINTTTSTSNGVLGAINKTTFASLAPKQTTNASMVLNLDSTQTLPGSSPTTIAKVSGTINSATAAAATVVVPDFSFRDEYGNLLTTTVTLTKTATAQNWTWSAAIGSAVPSANTVTGTLVFSAVGGALLSQSPVAAQTINLSNGSKPLTTIFDFGGLSEAAADATTGIANGITTSKIVLNGTLDSSALPAVGAINTGTGGAGLPPRTVVDADGALHTMYIEFTAGTGSTYNWTMDAANPAGAATKISGTVTFDPATGLFKSFTQDKAAYTFGTLPEQPIKPDFSGLKLTSTGGSVITLKEKDVFDPANPSQTSNFSTSTTVYDSQGNAHAANLYFVKTGANSWDWHAKLPDATGGSPINGTLAFNANGILTAQTPSATAGQQVLLGSGVTSPQTITFDFGTNITTQLASSSSVSSLAQDGYAAGKLLSTKIDDNGYVTATYSNNQSQRIAQIALAKFASLGGLEKSGNSLFLESAKSGTPLSGTASDFGIKIFTNSLEQSNVDMANQLVNMIKLQRAYSGNSKTITSADEMMQETLGLKR